MVKGEAGARIGHTHYYFISLLPVRTPLPHAVALRCRQKLTTWRNATAPVTGRMTYGGCFMTAHVTAHSWSCYNYQRQL